MRSESPRPLPTLQLPAAILSFWPAAADGGVGDDPRARQTAAAYASRTGVVQLDDRRFAVLPQSTRESVFEDAATLGQAILAQLRKSGADGEISGILISPGEIVVEGDAVVALDDELLDDLGRRPPRFKSIGVYFTGYAASWLRGRFQFDSAGLYDGPSGRRVPIHRMVGEAPQLGPWRNPELLSRQVKIPRPEIREALGEARNGVLRVHGPLGSGKSHAVWHYLLEQEGPKLWFRVGRPLFGTAILARRLVAELDRLAPDSLPAGGEELRRPEDLAPVRAAELLAAWLDNACRRLGATLWIVCDSVQSAVEADLDLLANLLARRGSIFRLLLISRSGGPVISQLADLPQLEIAPMSGEELDELAEKLFAGLSIDKKVERRLLTAAAGFPFALEEGLTDLVHRGLVRRIYGSFFYGGGSEVEYSPSRRLVRIVAAEAERLGEALPLRILAAAGQAVPVEHLEGACADFGVELQPAWENAIVSAGWLTTEPSAWGQGLTFACPAYGRSLLETVHEESVDVLRQALGQVTAAAAASPEELTWQTYQLMAGTADALPSLLQLSKKADTPETRLEIFKALEKEYQLHRSREGDPATELDLLWKLLPLGHRLGKLGQLGDALARSLELTVGDPTRFAALAMVKAEHDRHQGRYASALKSIEAALMASEGGPPARRALLVLQLGKTLQRQGRGADAKRLFEDLLRVVGPTVLGATCHHHLGEIALFEGDLERARHHHEKALAIRREHSGQERAVGLSLIARGDVLLAEGNYPDAFETFLESLESFSESDEVELSEAELGLGRALRAQGDAAAASRRLRRALEFREGRGDVIFEERARLELAANHLELGHLDQALDEARRATFQLMLLPASPALGEAETLIGRILFQMRRWDEAEASFREASRLHQELGPRDLAAMASSWILQLALRANDRAAILRSTADLEARMQGLVQPPRGELLHFRLYSAYRWLRAHEASAPEPIETLRTAHRELMRKLSFLPPRMRHQFLFNVRAHEELLNAAVEHGLSMPSFGAAPHSPAGG